MFEVSFIKERDKPKLIASGIVGYDVIFSCCLGFSDSSRNQVCMYWNTFIF